MRKLDSKIQSIARSISHRDIAQRVTLAGLKLSRSNAVMYSQALRGYCFLCEDIAVHFYQDPWCIIPRLKNSLSVFFCTDITAILGYLSDLRDFCNRLTGPVTYRSFRAMQALKADQYGIKDWKMLLAPIKELEQKFVTDPMGCPHLYRDISSFYVFFKKLPFTDIGVEEKMLQAYLETETRLGSLVIDDEVSRGVRDIITGWFKDIKFDDLRPRHGNGSTALGKLSIYEKYKNLHADSILLRCLNVDPLLAMDFFPVGVGSDLHRCSLLQYVPKTATKLRPISMEEPALQYVQQGVRIKIQDYIKKHRFLSKVIKFDSQAQNQMYAHMGSMFRNISTIDLSAASDSVSLRLARQVFAGVPALYRHLMASRSHSTKLPNGDIIRLNKFASMGSATTFPVECIIFAAVVQYSYNSYDGIEKQLDPNFFSVYGDDIICSDYITASVIENLEHLGFVVNKDKSFFGPVLFRESCGKEYIAGVDCSPVYFRQSPVNSTSPEAMMSLIGVSNTYYSAGYTKLSRFCIRWVRALFGPVPFTSDSDDTAKCYSESCTNFHLIMDKRASTLTDNYQCEYRGYRTIVTKSGRQDLPAPDEDDVRYFEWLKSRRPSSTKSWLENLFPAAKGSTIVHHTSTRLGWGYLAIQV